MRYFLIKETIDIGSFFTIQGSDANHIINVLRFKLNDKIGLFDKRGFEYKAVIKKISKNEVKIVVTEKFLSESESRINITVAQGILKEKKMDRTLKSLTELGITCWIPFIAERSISTIDKERERSRVSRWQKIADEAIKQSKRPKVPEIYPPLSFIEALDISKEKESKKIIFYEEEKNIFQDIEYKNHNQIKNIFIMIGTEGGFTQEEISLAKNYGFMTATLGNRILRAETAAIAATAIMQFLYGDMKNCF